MRQLLRILLLSLSITAVEWGILYLLMEHEDKHEQHLFTAAPGNSTPDGSSNSLRQLKRQLVPYTSGYRPYRIHKPAHIPRSDGRVYRR